MAIEQAESKGHWADRRNPRHCPSLSRIHGRPALSQGNKKGPHTWEEGETVFEVKTVSPFP